MSKGGEEVAERNGEEDAPQDKSKEKGRDFPVRSFRNDQLGGGNSFMKKIKLLIRGDVQDVGFRLCLLKEAQKLSIPNFFADNLPDKKTVVAFVGGKAKIVDEYIEVVKAMNTGNPRVVEVSVENFDGNIRETSDYVDYLHTEQLIKGVEAVGDLGVIMKEVGVQFAETVSNGFKKVDRQLDELPQKVSNELKK